MLKPLVKCILFLLLLGCDNHTASQRMKKNGLIYCGSDQPYTLNPQLADGGILPDSISSQVFDRLVELDMNTFLPVPMLAKAWQINDDGKEYLFTLRENVHFHQNQFFTPTRTLNAKDVAFSFSRIIDAKSPFNQVLKTSYPWFESHGFIDLVARVEAINEYQVRFVLNKADASFLSILATSYAVVHSKEYADQLIKSNQLWLMDNHPIGTGPFWFKEFQPNRLVRLKQHSLYWKTKPKPKQIIYDISYRGIGEVSKLLAQECDVLSGAKPNQLSIISQNKNFTLVSQASMNVAFLTLNTQHPMLAKKSVRQAISYAIDKKRLSKVIYHGEGIPAASMLPPASWANNENFSDEYNPQLAKSLLAHAGLIQGFDIDLLVPMTPRPYNPNPLKMAKLIQADLSKVNIRVNIVSKPKIDHKKWKKEMLDLGMVLKGWVADNADPDNFLRPNLSCDGIPSGINLSNWCKHEFEQLLDSALKTDDRSQRTMIYIQAQKLIQENLPLIPLTHGKHFKVIDSKIQGYQSTPFGDKNFADITRDL